MLTSLHLIATYFCVLWCFYRSYLLFSSYSDVYFSNFWCCYFLTPMLMRVRICRKCNEYAKYSVKYVVCLKIYSYLCARF